MARKKILFITHSSLLYGAQRSLFDIIVNLDETKYMSIVVAPTYGPLTRQLDSAGISVFKKDICHWAPPPDDFGMRYIYRFFHGLRSRAWAIARLIEEHDVDVVYTNTVTLVEGAIAARMARRPHIWHLRENIVGNNEIRRIIPGFVIRIIIGYLSDLIICNSVSLKRNMISRFFKSKVCVVYNGVSISERMPSSLCMAGRAMLGIEGKDKIVIIVGALHERKGHKLFLRSAKLISERVRNIRFLVVGEGSGSYKEELMSLCESLGIVQKVMFLGYQEEVTELIALSDVLVMSSNQEPFGKVVIEAMAQYTPVVSTRCGGPEEIIEHGNSGLLVKNGSEEEMAESVVSILQDSELAGKLATNGYKRALELFELKKSISHIESCLDLVAQI